MKPDRILTPPPELFADWLAEALDSLPWEKTDLVAARVARLAYAAGADRELEACSSYVAACGMHLLSGSLRSARRPKPPAQI